MPMGSYKSLSFFQVSFQNRKQETEKRRQNDRDVTEELVKEMC